MTAATRTVEALRGLRRIWLRVLIAALGGCQLLMAAGATRGLLAIGLASGIALIAGAAVAATHRAVAGAAFALGTIPFAAVAWTALVPVVVLLLVAALAAPVLRPRGAAPLAPTQGTVACHVYDGHDSDHGGSRRDRDDDHAGTPARAG